MWGSVYLQVAVTLHMVVLQISPSIIYNEIINPANKKDCFSSLKSSMNLSQRFHVIFPSLLLNQ